MLEDPSSLSLTSARLSDPSVYFAAFNRPAFEALKALIEHSVFGVGAGRGVVPKRVSLMGGIAQVRVLLDLAKDNGLVFDFGGATEDGGADILVGAPSGSVVLVVEAKPPRVIKQSLNNVSLYLEA